MSDHPFSPPSKSIIKPPSMPKPRESLEADYARLKAEVERLDNLVRYWSEKYQNENARFLRASERIDAKEGKPSV